MPRQLLRDGHVVDDDWEHVPAGGRMAGTDGSSPGLTRPGLTRPGLLLKLADWLAERSAWLAHGGRLGVVLAPEHQVDLVTADLAHLALIAIEFPGPSEGRGYSQARLLRERHGFAHELRAIGHVRRDQLFFMARCGFNSFELAEQDLAAAQAAFHTFSAEYQPSNDAGLPARLARR